MTVRKVLSSVGVCALAGSGVLLGAAAASASPEIPLPFCGTQPSAPVLPQGWEKLDGTVPAEYVPGPDGADGAGSIELNAKTPADKSDFYHATDTKLSDVGALGYKQHTEGAAQASYQLKILDAKRTDGDSTGFTTLVWEPYQNGQPLGSSDGWVNEANIQDGKWWSTRPIAGANGQSQLVSLDDIVAANPDAHVTAYGVNLGRNNAVSTSNVDDIAFGCTTWNFEPNPDLGGSLGG